MMDTKVADDGHTEAHSRYYSLREKHPEAIDEEAMFGADAHVLNIKEHAIGAALNPMDTTFKTINKVTICIKSMDFVFKMMDIVFKMMDFVFKMMILMEISRLGRGERSSRTRSCECKMMKFCIKNEEELCIKTSNSLLTMMNCAGRLRTWTTWR